MKIFTMLFGACLALNVHAQTVTALSGFYRNGQVFLTWNNTGDSATQFRVYRSVSKITQSNQLATAEYLGLTSAQSARDHMLSQHDSTDRYLHIDSAGLPLLPTQGLFVATTLADGSYYYAVTTVSGGNENQLLQEGANSMASPVAELVSKPKPVFQEYRVIEGITIEIYTTFFSSKLETGEPPVLSAGFLPFDFSINRNGSTGMFALKIFFHPGGSDFLDDIEKTVDGLVRLNITDDLPDPDITSGWWGAHGGYDVYNEKNNKAPASGINNNYTQQRIYHTIDWAISHLPIDSNRIYIESNSQGSPGAFFYMMTYPERIAAIELHTGVFNYGFLNDWQADCSLNTGKKNRKEGDKRLGTVATNLPSSLGMPTYDALNGGNLIHEYPDRSYPFVYSINGKYDKQMGWTEKIAWYDSMNANRFGGYYYWDKRDHSASTGAFWDYINFDLHRYRRDRSFPAFSYCSLNEDFGDGNGLTGEDYGTLNGPLDWVIDIQEDSATWTTKLFVKNLMDREGNTVVYPDSCTADVTPRRLQQLQLPNGATVQWFVIHLGDTVQNGTVLFNGGPLVIPAVKIFRDTSVLSLTVDNLLTYYLDADGDGFGNPDFSVMAASLPEGYINNDKDCNDSNAAIHPNAADVCNDLDDNCDGITDENEVTVTITPNGTITACSPAVISLTSTVTGPVSAYQWRNNGAPISGATGNSFSVSSSGVYSASVSSSLCSSESAATAVNIHQKPVATITPSGIYQECKGKKVPFTSTTAGAGLLYQWLKGNALLSGATNSSYTTTGNETGKFSVIVTNVNGCKDTSDETTLNRLNNPVAVIEPQGNLDICSAGSVVLQAGSGAGYTYKWYLNNSVIAGAKQITYTAIQPGEYKVQVTNGDGCKKKSPVVEVYSSCRMHPAAGTEAGSAVLPNPNPGQFSLFLPFVTPGTLLSVRVVDVTGKNFPVEHLQTNPENQMVPVNIPTAPAGLYVVEVIWPGGSWHTQVILTR